MLTRFKGDPGQAVFDSLTRKPLLKFDCQGYAIIDGESQPTLVKRMAKKFEIKDVGFYATAVDLGEDESISAILGGQQEGPGGQQADYNAEDIPLHSIDIETPEDVNESPAGHIKGKEKKPKK